MKKKITLFVGVPICFIFVFAIVIIKTQIENASNSKAASLGITNGIQFTDTSQSPIHAHGGGIIQYGNYFYWYGEYRDENNYFKGVRCYRSTDMLNWELRGEVLKPNSAAELKKCNVERPKVIYNKSTKEFIMWMHWENGINYGEARAAVAYSNTPDGAFTYKGSFRPYKDSGVMDHGKSGYMSRDCNLFVDTDGTAYFISSSNENMDLHLYRLTSDYKSIDKLVTKLFVGSQREAPCLIKRNNYYYLITSGCTGWSPNQAKYAYSSKIGSDWSELHNLGDSKTYDSQPTCIVTIQGTKDTSYLYMGDRWAGAWGGKVNDSKYVWLPLIFQSSTNLNLSYYATISIDAAKGTISTDAPSASKYYKIVNKNSGKLLTIPNNATANDSMVIQASDTNAIGQHWKIENQGNGTYKIINQNSKKVLEVNSWSTANGAKINQWTDNNGTNQLWTFIEVK